MLNDQNYVKGESKNYVQPSKTFTLDSDVVDVLYVMRVENNGKIIGYLEGQLDRKLYVRVNKVLEALGGEWSRKERGHIFAKDPREQLDQILKEGSLTIIKDGFFRTPEVITRKMIDTIGLGNSILDPSAGDGAIVDVIVARGVLPEDICCVELNPDRCAILADKGYKTTCMNILEFKPQMTFDRIFMNPPFEIAQDIDHVRYCYELLSEGGSMAVVMSEGTFFRENRKAQDFRQWLNALHANVESLPSGIFKDTMIKTRIVYINRV